MSNVLACGSWGKNAVIFEVDLAQKQSCHREAPTEAEYTMELNYQL